MNLTKQCRQPNDAMTHNLFEKQYTLLSDR
jgi:hypothetical protein